ncbi:MAG: 2-oxo acid dehydrogenase subunit E2 [Fimbriimonadaceae bacterium]|nr:2-oxo acid dehydrogenase subunit E2 [Fimbriimonadaceae bacterium]
MAVEILMPELGESVHEGTVSRWLKKEGDAVKEDEPIVEIMTDKVNTELPAPATGVLSKIIIPEGATVKVFEAMGTIDDGTGASASTETKAPETKKAEAKPEPKPQVNETPSTPEPAAPAVGPNGRVWYTPVVRAIAKERGISDAELSTIQGSGSGNRVTKKDLEAYISGGRQGGTAMPNLSAKPAPIAAGPDQEVVPLVGMRKMIAEAMVRSSQVPTVSTVIQIDVTNLVKFRESNKDAFQSANGVKLTYTPFFIKALTEALLEFRMVNASLQEGNVVYTNGVHMGCAVSLGEKGDEGLIVPVIRDCHKKSLVEIARDLEAIAKKARNNTLQVTDVQGGTFTLTNPGSYGALFGTPMINAPQAAIGGAYAIQKLPVIVDDMIAMRSMMYFVLTYDHRIIDGLLAGRFLQSFKKRLEGFDFYK